MHNNSVLAAALAAACWPALHGAPAAAAEAAATLSDLTVTATREARALAETPAAVGVVGEATLQADRPTHPSQVIGLVPGAAVAVTNGEGHSTAIRQPFSTAPVYLFLEDGIPTRSTGFFNHNALYEVNIPQAGGVEVTRGPGSALYGSDAIGGVINTLTRRPPLAGEAELSAEAGSHGWRRLLLDGGNGSDAAAWRADLNLTHSDGWRARTAYDRQSLTLRRDDTPNAHDSVKTVLAASRIDQETGANSALPEAVYFNDPTRNLRSIGFRKVDAARLSAAWEREDGNTLWSVTPYLRDNRMELLATFTLPNDPTLALSENRSFGLLGKWRRAFPERRLVLIGGLDLDYSPGSRQENRLNLTRTGAGASRDFLAYSLAGRAYDYAVNFRGVSPYLQAEVATSARLRVVGGLRYDHLHYAFDNALPEGAVAVASSVNGGAPSNAFYGQAADGSRSFSHLSPKLGVTYDLGEGYAAHASYNRGFRAPSEGQLFRGAVETSAPRAVAAAASALGLKPVKADQFEVGLRRDRRGLAGEVVAYRLVKRDDILSFRDPLTNATQVTNAGKTTHQGVEVGFGAALPAALRVDLAFSWARHTYTHWQVPNGVDLSGKEMESAPRRMATTRLSWLPAPGSRLMLEWQHLGSYWMDAGNTERYAGHNLANLRGEWAAGKQVALFGSVTNLADRRYADSASVSSGERTLSPGLPRTYVAGVEIKW